MLDFQNPPQSLVEQYYKGLQPYWFPVLREADLEYGALHEVQLLGRDIVLGRLDGEVVAMSNICRHFQAKLSLGTIERGCNGLKGDILRCAYHGWAYDKSGACVQIPQLDPNRAIPPGARIECFAVTIKWGLIWVCLSDTPKFDLAELAECAAPDMKSLEVQYTDAWGGSAFRMVQSALDDYHFPWLHQGVLGSREHAAPPQRRLRREGTRLISEFSVVQPANITNGASAGGVLSPVDYRMIVDMPTIIRLVKKNAAGTYVVCFYPTPLAHNRTALFWTVWRNYDLDQAAEQRVIEIERFIQTQDKEIVATQRMWTMRSLRILGADNAITEYLSWLSELGLPQNL